MPDKPKYGSPCNGCGGCCQDQKCILGQDIFGGDGGCPAVMFNDGISYCDVSARPKKYLRRACGKHGTETIRNAVLTVIASGKGCDALVAGETRTEEEKINMLAKIDEASYLASYALTQTR